MGIGLCLYAGDGIGSAGLGKRRGSRLGGGAALRGLKFARREGS